jgi:hypothetical protein
MNDSGQDARALLAAARRAGQGPPGPRRRVRERVLGSVATGSVTSTALLAEAAMLPVAASPGGALTLAAVKAFVAGTAVGAVLTTAVSSLLPHRVPPAPAPVPTERREATGPRNERAEGLALVPAPSAAASAPVLVGSSRAAAKSSIADETLLLGKVQVALRQGQPAVALELLDQYREAYPRGVLQEEATAARVVALCALGRSADGRRWADEFVRLHPKSLLLGRVRAACTMDR